MTVSFLKSYSSDMGAVGVTAVMEGVSTSIGTLNASWAEKSSQTTTKTLLLPRPRKSSQKTFAVSVRFELLEPAPNALVGDASKFKLIRFMLCSGTAKLTSDWTHPYG